LPALLELSRFLPIPNVIGIASKQRINESQ
jgi:hypothetical protein